MPPILTDAATVTSVLEWMAAGAAKDEANRNLWLERGDPHTAWTFQVKALAMQTVAARLLEEHVNEVSRFERKETPCPSEQ